METLIRHKPNFKYSGLTIVMSNPSRFDKVNLLSANGGNYFEKECLFPQLNRHQCDIRLAFDKSPLLDGTKVILCLGELAQRVWMGNPDVTLGAQRGSPIIHKQYGIPCISSYLPQDCVDVRNYEATHNVHLQQQDGDEEGDTKQDARTEKSRHGKTSRKNWAFWLQRDVQKCVRILKNDGKFPALYEKEPEYIIYPPANLILHELYSYNNDNLFIDIETDDDLNITCFAFSKGTERIIVVPVLRYNYTPAYAPELICKIFKAVALAFKRNIVIAHNGAAFDFFVFAHKYRIPIARNKAKDTLIQQHRCFLEAEKSLGHCMSMWTYEPYHKDDGVYMPINEMQEMLLWKYCGKDVFGMALVYQEQMKYAQTQPGLLKSFEQGNASIRPYLTTTLLGIRYQQNKVEETIRNNDRMMRHYMRAITCLVGAETLKLVKPKSSKSDKPLPMSNKQCVNYFHGLLGYDVIKRSRKTGAPSLDKKAILKLRLKYNNPVLDLIISFRELSKETGALKFTPFKDKEGKTPTTI